jgi:hypothetical protein
MTQVGVVNTEVKMGCAAFWQFKVGIMVLGALWTFPKVLL